MTGRIVRVPVRMEVSSVHGADATEYAEVPAEQWHAMTEEQRDAEVAAQAADLFANFASYGYSLNDAEEVDEA